MRIVFTVTNDLNYDRRMIRICSSLSAAGHKVRLVGIKRRNSLPLRQQPFEQVRLSVPFHKGPGFYASANIRLFLALLFTNADCFCAIDMDTMPAVYRASRLRRITRVYDAHEFFSEQKEVVTRPRIHRFWSKMEKRLIPKFPTGYTVSRSIAEAFTGKFGVHYDLIRNLPDLKTRPPLRKSANRTILYRGAVNEARGFESLIPAMQQVDAKLVVYGDGNFFEQAKRLTNELGLQNKIQFEGMFLPDDLSAASEVDCIGINLVEPIGLNQQYSLANKFFDYIMAGIPQVTMNFPEYKRVNDAHDIAVLIDDISEQAIANALNYLLTDLNVYKRLSANCEAAAAALNWQQEEKKLIAFYDKLK